MVVILASLLFYALLKMYGYFNFVKAGFKLNWVQTQTYWKLGFSLFYISLVTLLLVLYATNVIHIYTLAEKNEHKDVAFSPLGAFAMIAYFCYIFMTGIIGFAIYVLIKNKNRISISADDFDNFDIEKYNFDIDKSYIKDRKNYTMFRDYITNSMMFKKHPKIYATKVVYYSLMFIYSTPVYDQSINEQEIDPSKLKNISEEFHSLLTNRKPIAELFQDNKEYITFVLKTAYQKVNSIYPLDEQIYKNAVLKACK